MNCHVITARRPESLFRALGSFLDQGSGADSSQPVVVFDDSTEASFQAANRDVISGFALEHGANIAYFGREERERFFTALSNQDQGAAEMYQFALFGYDNNGAPCFSGANRNASLLLSAGERAVSLDDDTLPRFWRPGKKFSPLGEHAVPELLPFGDEKILEKYIVPSANTVLTEFRDVLGVRPDHVSGASHVKIAMAGIRGGRWYSNPYAHLVAPLAWHKRIWPSEKDYHIAKSSPFALLLAHERVFTRSSFFVTTCFGYDGSEVLPPFFPGIRGDDAVWARLVQILYPASPICHLPFAIEHDRTGKPPFFRNHSAGVTFSGAEITIALLRYISSTIPAISPYEKLVAIGRRIVEFTSLSVPHRDELMEELLLSFYSRRIALFRSRLEVAGGRPRFWARDAIDHVEQLCHTVVSQSGWIPREFRYSSESEGRESFIHLLELFGKLLIAWPEIWECSLRSRGVREFTQ